MSRTVLIVDAGVGRALALGLVLRGFWVDDCRVPLLQHLLQVGVCAPVVLAVRRALLLHCEGEGGIQAHRLESRPRRRGFIEHAVICQAHVFFCRCGQRL